MEREQEIEILERLCGWQWFYSDHRHVNRMLRDPTDNDGYWQPVTTDVPIDGFDMKHALPPIPTDETAMMLVVRAMRARGYGLDLTTMGETAWNALWYMPEDSVVGGFAADADTLPMAICLAALEYIRAQPEGE